MQTSHFPEEPSKYKSQFSFFAHFYTPVGRNTAQVQSLEKNLTLQFKLCYKTCKLCKKVPQRERWPVGGRNIFELLFLACVSQTTILTLSKHLQVQKVEYRLVYFGKALPSATSISAAAVCSNGQSGATALFRWKRGERTVVLFLWPITHS